MTRLGHMMTCLDNNPSTEHAFFFCSGKEAHPVNSVTSGRHLRPDSSHVSYLRHWYLRRLQCASAFQIPLFLFIFYLCIRMLVFRDVSVGARGPWHTWRRQTPRHLGCPSLTSTSEAESLAGHCACQSSWLTSIQEFSWFFLSALWGGWGLQACTTKFGFP